MTTSYIIGLAAIIAGAAIALFIFVVIMRILIHLAGYLQLKRTMLWIQIQKERHKK